jgi:immune inhibitor A
MEADRASEFKWFFIGLVGVMGLCLITTCLCAGSLVLLSGFAEDVFYTLESYEEVLSTPSGEAPSKPTIETTPTTTTEATSEPTTEVKPNETSIDANQAENNLYSLSNIDVPVNDPTTLAKRLKGIEYIPDVLTEPAAPIPIGTVQTFWVSDIDDINFFQVQAEMVYASDHVYFWIEQGVEYIQEDVREIVDDFESHIYPTNRAFFGSELTPGVDGDPHLYILFARGLGYSVAGYYSSTDELSSQIHEYSNEHEMFYLSADNVYLWDEYTYGVLAHEFQHMIHENRDSNEDTWLNEGFAELATLLNGYGVGYTDYAYVADPDQPLTYWSSEPGSNAPNYGQAFMIVAYFLDRFGAEATQAVVANPANGLDSIDQVLASMEVIDPLRENQVTIDDVYGDWAAAMWLNDPSVGDGRYAYKTYVPPQPNTADRFDTCPFEKQSGKVNQYGIDYIRFRCQGEYKLTFEGASTVPIVPTEPYSGEYAFWSNRGNTSDMILTRVFDFTNISGPITLDYWVWYDVEEDWDYLYLEASNNGGETWKILTTPSGTNENPSGNSYGWGYTGVSGGGIKPEWINEKVDLSEYAGQEILLRFEYITDAALNGEGWLLDDLSIDVAGYSEDFEDGDGGWVAEGFVRLYNLLPQTFRLLLIEQGSETRVREITLQEEQNAEVNLSLGGVFDEAILVVIGTTRYTWQPATYELQVVP